MCWDLLHSDMCWYLLHSDIDFFICSPGVDSCIIWSWYIAHTRLTLVTFLSHPLECWDYRCILLISLYNLYWAFTSHLTQKKNDNRTIYKYLNHGDGCWACSSWWTCKVQYLPSTPFLSLTRSLFSEEEPFLLSPNLSVFYTLLTRREAVCSSVAQERNVCFSLVFQICEKEVG